VLSKKDAILLLLLGALVLGGCARDAAQPDASASNPVDAASDEFSFFAAMAEPYRGTQLRGISETTPPSTYVKNTLAPLFESVTGIHVDLELNSLPDVERITQSDSSAYDFIYLEQDLFYSYIYNNRLVNITQFLATHPSLASPDFNPVDFTSFVEGFQDPVSHDLFGVPIEAFLKIYAYRKDLFEDPEIRAAFYEQYGYPLTPAVTNAQYRDLAEFFTQYGQENGLDLFGTAVMMIVGHQASFGEFFEAIAPSFGVYNWGINLETRRATEANGGALDSAQAKAALTFWLGLREYAPPGANEAGWDEVIQAFATGQVAQAWIYGEYISWLATDPTRSDVVGKVGVALPPSENGIIEDAELGNGYLGYYDGAAFAVPIGSQNVEAAMLWLQFLAQESIQPEWAAVSGRVIHLATFDDPLIRLQDRQLDGYFTLMKRHGELFAGAPPLPDPASVRSVISTYLDQAILGTLSPSDALDQAAAAVDIIMAQSDAG